MLIRLLFFEKLHFFSSSRVRASSEASSETQGQIKGARESLIFQKTVIESTFDYRIEAKYDYWIVHFMNGLLNQQTKSFFRE